MTLKPRKCKNCKSAFVPFRRIETWCSFDCGLKIALVKLTKQKTAAAMADRKAHQAARIAAKPLSWWHSKCQAAFNSWVRARDKAAGLPCISSGKPLDWTGNMVDAGHFRTRGSAGHLRYHPDNCHAQSKHDNLYKSGNVGAYRLGLIERIGLDRVLALENNNTPRKWTRQELQVIEADFKARLKEII